MAENVTGEMYYKIDGQLAEIKRQLRQREGYPHKPQDLQGSLQDIIEGRFGTSSADTRFALLSISEPIIIPEINIAACVEKYRSHIAVGMSVPLKWEYFRQPPLLHPGSEYRLHIYVTREHVWETECIEFIKRQNGVLPNLHGLFIAWESDLFPRHNICSVISASTKKNASHRGVCTKNDGSSRLYSAETRGIRIFRKGNTLQIGRAHV